MNKKSIFSKRQHRIGAFLQRCRSKSWKGLRTTKNIEKIAAILLATVLTTIAASAQAVKHVNANGLSFAYVEAGKGPPVVLVHGSVFDYREWSKQIKPLARHYRVIAYSRRYHWPNAA